MKQEATQWHIDGDGCSISAKGMGNIAKVLPVYMDKAERQRRALLIVTAVNSYEGLREALEEVQRYFKTYDYEVDVPALVFLLQRIDKALGAK